MTEPALKAFRTQSPVWVVVVASLLAAANAQQASWPQFRGPGSLPVSETPGLPVSWSQTENVEWVADIEGMGWSSPVVSNGKVFLTSATSDKPLKQPSLGVDFSNDYVAELMKEGKSEEEVMRLVNERDAEFPTEVTLRYQLTCVDLESGKILWEREFHQGAPPAGRHRKNSYTSETPVTDGVAVYVYVSFLGLYAFDFDGNQLWRTPLEPHPVYLEFGGGASPALHGDKLFILNDNQEDSFLAGFDKRTGRQLWRTVREGLGDKHLRSSWSTPYVWENERRTEIVTHGPGYVISYDLNGKELWRMSGLSTMSIQSPFAADGLLYVASGVAGGGDKPMVAIRAGGSGDITPPEGSSSSEYVAWYNRVGGGTYLPTPVVYEGGVYVVTDKGIFWRLDATTGKETYKSRIHRTARNFTSSPWAYNGMIFCINEEGDTFVIKAGEEFELIGINSLDDFTQATPAIVGDRLLVRTQTKLYSIRGQIASRAGAQMTP